MQTDAPKVDAKQQNSLVRRGFFLVMVLVVVVIATMAAYSFTDLMLVYERSSHLSGDLVQARVAAESGAEVTRLLLSDPPQTRLENGGVYNNPNLFQAIPISMGLDGQTPCNYSIVAPGLDEQTGLQGGIRFGLQNESARLNINAMSTIDENSDQLLAIFGAVNPELVEGIDNLAVSLLLSLPGMTEDIAYAILDWMDVDDEPREENGAELEYYQGLPTPYQPTNGPFLTVEELLLVRDVTPQLLFGADANRNGVLDPDEQQRYGVTADTPGALGWAQYITIRGGEANKTFDGQLRINANKSDLETLYEELVDALGDETFASYIVAYRIAGQSGATAAVGNTNNAQSGGPWSANLLEQMDLSAGSSVELQQIMDLVGSTVTIDVRGTSTSFTSPFEDNPVAAAVYMPLIMNALTTSDDDFLPGRININECPAELLYGVPLLTEEQIEQILEAREVESDDLNRRHETWLMVEGIVDSTTMRSLIPLFTCGGDVYRGQIIGYFEKGGAAHRSEFIIDATTVNPKIISWRDLTHLGRGFDLSVLGLRTTTADALGGPASIQQQ